MLLLLLLGRRPLGVQQQPLLLLLLPLLQLEEATQRQVSVHPSKLHIQWKDYARPKVFLHLIIMGISVHSAITL